MCKETEESKDRRTVGKLHKIDELRHFVLESYARERRSRRAKGSEDLGTDLRIYVQLEQGQCEAKQL